MKQFFKCNFVGFGTHSIVTLVDLYGTDTHFDKKIQTGLPRWMFSSLILNDKIVIRVNVIWVTKILKLVLLFLESISRAVASLSLPGGQEINIS